MASRPPTSANDSEHGSQEVVLLFVNKDIGTNTKVISHEDISAERSRIWSHVQRNRYMKQLPTQRHNRRSSLPEHANLFRQNLKEDDIALIEDELDDSITDVTAFRNDRWASPAIASNNFREEDVLDPFCTTRVPITKASHGIFQFFLNAGWKAHLKKIGKIDASDWNTSQTELPLVVRNCLENELHLNAFLAYNVMRMKFYQHLPFGRLESPELLIFKTVHGLRLHLSNVSLESIDQHIILDIFFLAFAEFYRQEYAVVRTHLLMIRHIVEAIGGFKYVSDYVRECCCLTELCFDSESGESPVFELTWDPGPLNLVRELEILRVSASSRFRAFAAGFTEALKVGFFDDSSAMVMSDLVTDIRMFHHIRNDTSPVASDAQWQCMRSRAYIHRLLSLPLIQDTSSRRDLRIRSTTTTILILLCYENTSAFAKRSGKVALGRVKSHLEKSLSNFSGTGGWQGVSGMLLWIMITGFFLAEGGADEDWFRTRALNGCKQLHITSYTEMCNLMDRYFWFEQMQAASLARLAGHVLEWWVHRRKLTSKQRKGL